MSPIDVYDLRNQKLQLEAELISLKLDGKEKTVVAEQLKAKIDLLQQNIDRAAGIT